MMRTIGVDVSREFLFSVLVMGFTVADDAIASMRTLSTRKTIAHRRRRRWIRKIEMAQRTHIIKLLSEYGLSTRNDNDIHWQKHRKHRMQRSTDYSTSNANAVVLSMYPSSPNIHVVCNNIFQQFPAAAAAAVALKPRTTYTRIGLLSLVVSCRFWLRSTMRKWWQKEKRSRKTKLEENKIDEKENVDSSQTHYNDEYWFSTVPHRTQCYVHELFVSILCAVGNKTETTNRTVNGESQRNSEMSQLSSYFVSANNRLCLAAVHTVRSLWYIVTESLVCWSAAAHHSKTNWKYLSIEQAVIEHARPVCCVRHLLATICRIQWPRRTEQPAIDHRYT